MSANIRTLQAKKAATIEAARALNKVAFDADRDFSAEEQAQYDTMSATIQSLTARIEREQVLAIEEAGIAAAAPQHTSVDVGAARSIQVSENIEQDPKRGFKSFGEFARSVHAATMTKR